MSLNNFAQVRSQLVRLCNQERFPAAHMYLLGSGHPPERFPGLWEYLARRSSLSKDGVIAHEARHVLWQAGMRSEDIALREAEYFIEKGDWKSAIFVLEEVFGKAPDNRVAHFRLAEAHLLRARQDRSTARLQTSRDIALAMDAGHVPETASEALVVIDLLRFSGSLERARRRIDDARKRFPGDARIDLRAARVLEQLRDPNAAIAEWERIADQHPRYRTDALLKIYKG